MSRIFTLKTRASVDDAAPTDVVIVLSEIDAVAISSDHDVVYLRSGRKLKLVEQRWMSFMQRFQQRGIFAEVTEGLL